MRSDASKLKKYVKKTDKATLSKESIGSIFIEIFHGLISDKPKIEWHRASLYSGSWTTLVASFLLDGYLFISILSICKEFCGKKIDQVKQTEQYSLQSNFKPIWWWKQALTSEEQNFTTIQWIFLYQITGITAAQLHTKSHQYSLTKRKNSDWIKACLIPD